jgi:RNA polymerase sigma-70 factor, ECF subfamily
MLAIDLAATHTVPHPRDDEPVAVALPPDTGSAAPLQQDHHAMVAALVIEHRPAMLRLAGRYVTDQAIAEDVVQETWIAVLRGIERFDGRSSLKTWIFRILVNRAKTTGVRQSRVVPFTSLARCERDETSSADHADVLDDARGGMTRRVGGCVSLVRSIEDRVACAEEAAKVLEAIVELPPSQRAVITLRDVRSWPAEDVCVALGISEANQRVLLHRARARVRRRLDADETAIGWTA